MRPNTEIPRLAPVRRRHGFFSPPRSGRTRAGGWSLRTLARAAEHTGCSMPSSPRCTSSQSGALLEDPPPQPLHPVFKYNAQIICKVLGGGGREGDRGGRVGRSCASRGPRAGETPPPPRPFGSAFFGLLFAFIWASLQALSHLPAPRPRSAANLLCTVRASPAQRTSWELL